jgi:hypothetical protein
MSIHSWGNLKTRFRDRELTHNDTPHRDVLRHRDAFLPDARRLRDPPLDHMGNCPRGPGHDRELGFQSDSPRAAAFLGSMWDWIMPRHTSALIPPSQSPVNLASVLRAQINQT